MPHIQIRNANLHYTDTGMGAETLVFSHGVLWSSKMFDNQVNALKNDYRCITFDHRGQGKSEITIDGYDMDSLAFDAAELIEKLVGGPVHFVGLSMGGFVGMRLAARRPDLVKSLTLINTSAEKEPSENIPKYQILLKVMKWLGFGVVSNKVMPIMFGKKFLKDPARKALKKEWSMELLKNDRVGICQAMLGVMYREPILNELKNISCSTLVLVGAQDVATIPAKSYTIHQHIRDSRLVIIEGAGHTSTVEEPAQVNAVLGAFLETKVKLHP